MTMEKTGTGTTAAKKNPAITNALDPRQLAKEQAAAAAEKKAALKKK